DTLEPDTHGVPSPEEVPPVILRAGDCGQDPRYAALLALIELPASEGALPGLLSRFAVILAASLEIEDFIVAGLVPREGAPAALALRVAAAGPGSGPGAVETIHAPEFDLQSPAGLLGTTILDDLAPDGPFPGLTSLLHRRGNRSACLSPLGRATEPARVLCLGSSRLGAFKATDIEFLKSAANLFALAADIRESRQILERRQRSIEADRDLWRTLLEVNNAVVGTLDLEALRRAIAVNMRRVIAFEQTNLALLDADGRRFSLFSVDPDVPEDAGRALATLRIEDTPFRDPKALRAPLVLEPREMGFVPEVIQSDALFRSMKRFCLLPLTTPRRILGVLALASRSDDAFPPGAVDRAEQAAIQVAIAIENAMAFEEIAALKDRLSEEKLYLEEEIRGWNGFDEIVGESAALQRVLAELRTVAGTETTVLLLGETGTGKELFARAIHNLSGRRSRTLVAVNCAASPENLLESEWFGYERGAFTGALAHKTGRFELADKGTLFLDEVGDIPLHLQAKLLRVLQEHEIERLGAARPVRVDFRLVAATNADLQSMVNEKKFRSDLFYRLNVFPIRIPPLRERPDDIPALVGCFTRRYAKRLKREIDSVPRETMDALCRWHWPGNVRELQNVIERAVILSPGRTLQVPATEFSLPATPPATLENAEREHILKALLDTKWVVGGPTGAAARLGLKRTTLISTMKRLGIQKPDGQ
ncbi:MAG: sigma 54-interacting transcriptional regulator, partial [Thermoanaerobaculia bacterium]|nr:sigma 54-interacting transcriptional regulator [Thermoanaerobaculia bacterium]